MLLVAIYEHEVEGGSFIVRKGRGDNDNRKHGSIVWELDHFPVYDELLAEVEADYGGGTYNVYLGTANNLIAKSYHVPGANNPTP